jgi:cholesterol oxidase
LTTIQIRNAANPVQRVEALARFGRFFAGVLFDVYGGLFARPTVFNPDAPPRPKRLLLVPPPTVHACPLPDGSAMRLTRYQGGPKGPVLLAHGLGVSSRIFSTDTIPTNLLEYLVAHGYDAWLLDYRASIELPTARAPLTADHIARQDWPAAVARVCELTKAHSIQVVAHCYGSTTFTMALLAGLQGVRSAVCSQISTHVVAPGLTRFKSGLHLPSVLEALGAHDLTAYVDAHANWQDRLFDAFLKLTPVPLAQRCQSPVCHRITFLYSLLYQHEQLNEATHAALHEMFGVANIEAFKHLTRMVRAGHVVTADGAEDYVPHLERMALPITFIHGAENQCFLPESTEITYDLLREKNGRGLYQRHVIPGYGHIDCIFGKDAARDVYPRIVDHLDAT